MPDCYMGVELRLMECVRLRAKDVDRVRANHGTRWQRSERSGDMLPVGS